MKTSYKVIGSIVVALVILGIIGGGIWWWMKRGSSGGQSQQQQQQQSSSQQQPAANQQPPASTSTPPAAAGGQTGTTTPPNVEPVRENDRSVNVFDATLPATGYLAVYSSAEGRIGQELGHTNLLNAGSYQRYKIALSRPAQAGEVLYVLVQTDDGDQQFEPHTTDRIATAGQGRMLLTEAVVNGSASGTAGGGSGGSAPNVNVDVYVNIDNSGRITTSTTPQ